MMDLTDCDWLGARVRRVLRNSGYKTVEQAAQASDRDLMLVPEFGLKSLHDFRKAIAKHFPKTPDAEYETHRREPVTTSPAWAPIDRYRVPGGWLYHAIVHADGSPQAAPIACALCFVPDPVKP